MSLYHDYEKQLKKARIEKVTADRLEKNLMDPRQVFANIDSTFMRAKMAGLTKDQILLIIDYGVFANEMMDSKKLIALKPYMKYWPEDPWFASLAYRAGLQPKEIDKIGVPNIKREALETMIALQ